MPSATFGTTTLRGSGPLLNVLSFGSQLPERELGSQLRPMTGQRSACGEDVYL